MNPAIAGAALVFGLGLAAVATGRVPRERAIATLVLAAAAALVILRVLPLAIPMAMIGFSLWSRGAGIGRPRGRSRPPSGGQASEVGSTGLAMRLDHDTGTLDGTILTGPMAGRRLSELDAVALHGLAAQFRADEDEDSLALLLAYMERCGIGAEPDMGDAGSDPDSDEMSEAEALRVLGLEAGAGADEIRAAYHRLIKRNHPDRGGSDALAAMINRAKARLDPD